MQIRWLLLLGMIVALALCAHQALFAQDNPRLSYKRPAFSVAVEGDAKSIMSLETEKDTQTVLFKGDMHIAGTIEAKAPGKSATDIRGNAQRVTFTGKKNAGTLRLERVKGGPAPSLTVTVRATQVKTVLVGDVIEYRLDTNGLDVRGNVRLESSRNDVVIICRQLQATANADNVIESVIARGDVTFTGVTTPKTADDDKHRIDGKAGMATYTIPTDQAQQGSVLLEKGNNGPLPNMIMTNLTTNDRGEVSGSPINLQLQPFKVQIGRPGQSEAAGDKE